MKYEDYTNKKFNNKVESGSNDHKDSRNRQKTTYSATAAGSVRAHDGDTKLTTQNSKESSPAPDSQEGNSTIKKEKGKRKDLSAKSIYSDGAVAFAGRMRGV